MSNTLRPPVPENCDPDWRSLMERCWAAEPLESVALSDVFEMNRYEHIPATFRGPLAIAFRKTISSFLMRFGHA